MVSELLSRSAVPGQTLRDNSLLVDRHWGDAKVFLGLSEGQADIPETDVAFFTDLAVRIMGSREHDARFVRPEGGTIPYEGLDEGAKAYVHALRQLFLVSFSNGCPKFVERATKEALRCGPLDNLTLETKRLAREDGRLNMLYQLVYAYAHPRLQIFLDQVNPQPFHLSDKELPKTNLSPLSLREVIDQYLLNPLTEPERRNWGVARDEPFKAILFLDKLVEAYGWLHTLSVIETAAGMSRFEWDLLDNIQKIDKAKRDRDWYPLPENTELTRDQIVGPDQKIVCTTELLAYLQHNLAGKRVLWQNARLADTDIWSVKEICNACVYGFSERSGRVWASFLPEGKDMALVWFLGGEKIALAEARDDKKQLISVTVEVETYGEKEIDRFVVFHPFTAHIG